ncbi:MAG: BREX-4 system phosphatase PglZ [Candidatus Cloacimonetes bacterium]|nr:BREX-4 system phosphatase PglZ [Candidatus Cloacimonadota bacterium]
MIEFSKLESLIAEVATDTQVESGAQGRYPVRVILLDDFYHYMSLINKLNVRQIDLSELLESEDSWFGLSSLCDLVNNITESAVLYPVSEVLRFYSKDKLSGFFSSVLLKQNTHDCRIYLPIVGLQDRFYQFWNTFNRKAEGPPVWYLNTPADYQKTITVYTCDSSIESCISTISNNRDWLQYWRTERATPIITKTPSLKLRWDEFLPNGCFEKENLDTPRDLLQKIHRLEFTKPFLASELNLWNRMLGEFEKERDRIGLYPIEFLEHLLGIKPGFNYQANELLAYYLSCNNYQRWLIVMLAFQRENDDSYLVSVLLELDSYSDHSLIYHLYYNILSMDNEKHITERKTLIESIPANLRHQTNTFIEEFVSNLKERTDSLNLITTYTVPEKEYLILKLVSEDKLSELCDLFPEIRAYLDWDSSPLYSERISEQIRKYFSEYCLTKLRNRKSSDFDQLFSVFNENLDSFYKWYYKLNPIEIKEGVRVIQMDGVGAEWIPYIGYILQQDRENHNKIIKSIDICRAKLPTITKLNKIVVDQNFIRDYDQRIIHSLAGYSYPITLIEGMEQIKSMIRDYVLQSPENELYITSDHGSTCLCQKQFDCVSVQKDIDSKHEGRYYEGSVSLADNAFFFNTNQHYVALKHNVLSSVPHRETHGGATPEEVIVPYIHIVSSENTKIADFHIEIQNKTIEFGAKILNIAVKPKPDVPPILYILDMKIQPSINGLGYSYSLETLNSGKYKIKIEINKQLYFDSIELTTGFIEEDLFDE